MKTRNIKITEIILSFVMLGAGSASAAMITFNFGGSGGNLGPNETFTKNGLSVVVTSTGGNVHQDGNGLGVTGNPAGSRVGVGEELEFNFSPTAVSLLSSAVFERGNGAGRFDVYVDGVFGEMVTWGAGGGDSTFTHTFASVLTGTHFDFKAVADDFRVKKLTVDSGPSGVPTAGVPDGGSSFVLFSLGIAGMLVGKSSSRKRS